LRALFAALLICACAGKKYPDGCDPADAGCVTPCSTGNALAVGEHCTRGGDQCTKNFSTGKAYLCTTDFDKDAGLSFCTMVCSTNTDCGAGAVCTNGGGTGPKGCVPALCSPDDPGTP